MQTSLVLRLAVLVFGWALAISSAHSQPPSPMSPIIIGQTTAMTGGPSASVREMTLSANLYFDSINSKGGIKGRPIKLITLDDAYDPARSVANATKLLEEHHAIGMFLTRGTATTSAILPLLAKYRVPLVGPSTGAMSLHDPVNPYVFNVRSSYQAEAERAIEQIVGMELKKFGVIYVKDAFGLDAFAGVTKGLEKVSATNKTRIAPAYVETFDRNTTDFTKIIDVAASAQAQAVLIIATTEPTIALMRGIHAETIRRGAGRGGFFLTLSNNASGGFVDQLGDAAQGVIVAQVFPPERRMDIPLVAETSQLLKASNEYKDRKVSPAMLEGVAAAKVLVAALRAAVAPTSQQLIEALQSGIPFDIGWPGKEVSYTPRNHTGTQYTDLSIVSGTGKTLQFRR